MYFNCFSKLLTERWWDFMVVKSYIKSLIISLFAINIIFWIAIFSYFMFIEYVNNPAYLILKILLLGEPITFGIELFGYLKKSMVMYLLTMLLLLVNAILSLTDQTGLLDIVSLVLSLLLLLVLLLQWESMMD